MFSKSGINILLIIIPLALAQAQDPQYSQYYANPLYLNPAFTGAISYARAQVNFRNQWPSAVGNFTSYQASYDRFFNDLNLGVGGIALVDRLAEGKLKSTSVGFLTSYSFNINKSTNIRNALQFTVVQRNTDFSKYTFGDQLSADVGKLNVNTLDELSSAVGTKTFGSVSFGSLLTQKKFWLGISIHHLNRPNQAFSSNVNSLPIKTSIHGGYKFVFEDNRGLVKKLENSVTTTFNFKNQGQFNQLDLGVYWHFEPIIFGLWYRGLPLLKSANGYFNQDALVIMMGYKKDGFTLGYSFDITISKLGLGTGGCHEISCGFEFGSVGDKRKSFKKHKIMFMPYPKL